MPDLRVRTADYFRRSGGIKKFIQTVRQGVTEAAENAVKEADLSLSDVSFFVPPFLGANVVRSEDLAPLGFTPEQATLDLGLRLGHLGPSDQLVGLQHLIHRRLVGAGDYVLLLASGLAYSWTAVVVRIGAAAAAYQRQGK